VGKGALRFVPSIFVPSDLMGTLRFAHPSVTGLD
jgi:hypothetical protein